MTVSRKQKIVAHAKNLCCFILLPPISFNKHHVDIAIIPLMKLISISYDCLPSDEEREQIVKRLFDIIGGLIGSAIGLNGRRFKMYKLRSMYMDAEARKQELMKQNQVADGRMFKMENDPRIIGNHRSVAGQRATNAGALWDQGLQVLKFVKLICQSVSCLTKPVFVK